MTNPEVCNRRGSIYIAVTGTAMIVALVGFTSIHLSRLELRRSTAQNENNYARQLAQSGVEFAVAVIESNPSWRSTYSHGAEYTRSPSGMDADIIFRFLDNVDSDLANDTTHDVEIQGIGRYGDSEFRYSVTYAPSVVSESQSSQQVLKSYETAPNAIENVNSSNFLGQHFIADLPAEATSWTITQIDVYLEGHGAPSATLNFNFYTSDSNGQPDLLNESLAIPEVSLPPNGSPAYHQFNLSNATGLTPGQGYCFTLEQSGGGNAAIAHYNGGAIQTNSHVVRGGWGGWNTTANNSLRYRVHGTYMSPGGSGPFTIKPGSWQRIAVP